VLRGLVAYQQRNYALAHQAWLDSCESLEGDGESLCRSLALLAQASNEWETGRRDSASRTYSEIGQALGHLPASLLGLDVAALRASVAPRPERELIGPPALKAARRLPRRALLRFAVFLGLLLAAFLIARYSPLADSLTRENLISMLEHLRGVWWSPLVLVGLYLVISPLGIPVSPLVLAGGLVFGAALGSFLNLTGTFLGAALSYFLAKLLGRDFVLHLAGERFKRVESVLARHGFWTLVRVRFIPIPFAVVNFGAALAGIPLSVFLASSAVGLAPAMLVYTYFASSLVDVAGGGSARALGAFLLALLLLFALTLVPSAWSIWQRRRRYQALLERRREGKR
jgi:uncharacterized membrane protein YdjX (TVP38/TMEM64 family)